MPTVFPVATQLVTAYEVESGVKRGMAVELERTQWLHNIVNVLNATELFILKWLTLCYMNCISMRERERERSTAGAGSTLERLGRSHK